MSAFDGEQWSWKQVPEAETYLDFVENTVKVIPHTGKRYDALVSIPTDFFSWLSATLSRSELEQAKKKHIQFYLEEVITGDWLFGFEVKRSATIVFDLWRYTKSRFPAWATKA